MKEIIKEYPAKYDAIFKVLLALPLIVLAWWGLEISREDAYTGWAVGGTCIMVALFFWLIMPRKFVITDSGLKFVLGIRLSFSVPFQKIIEVRELKGLGLGFNLSTSFKEPVEIVRTKGMNINFSPRDRQEFLQDFNNIIEAWKNSRQRYDNPR
jgi:hypothetical protein